MPSTQYYDPYEDDEPVVPRSRFLQSQQPSSLLRRAQTQRMRSEVTEPDFSPAYNPHAEFARYVVGPPILRHPRSQPILDVYGTLPRHYTPSRSHWVRPLSSIELDLSDEENLLEPDTYVPGVRPAPRRPARPVYRPPPSPPLALSDDELDLDTPSSPVTRRFKWRDSDPSCFCIDSPRSPRVAPVVPSASKYTSGALTGDLGVKARIMMSYHTSPKIKEKMDAESRLSALKKRDRAANLARISSREEDITSYLTRTPTAAPSISSSGISAVLERQLSRKEAAAESAALEATA